MRTAAMHNSQGNTKCTKTMRFGFACIFLLCELLYARLSTSKSCLGISVVLCSQNPSIAVLRYMGTFSNGARVSSGRSPACRAFSKCSAAFLTTGIFDRAVLGADTYLSQGASAGEVHADRRGRRAGDERSFWEWLSDGLLMESFAQGGKEE